MLMSVKSNIKPFVKQLKKFQNVDIPNITRIALNETATRVKELEQVQMRKSFDRPKPQTIKIDDVEYVRKDSIQSVPDIEGDYAIVRCRNAGVHAGYIESRDANVLTLKDSRRLWRWWSNFTLSELAMTGVMDGKHGECKFSCTVPKNDLTVSDVAEVIYCTPDAKQSILSVSDYTNA